MDEERMKPGDWLWSLLCLPFSALTLMIRWQEGHLDCKKPHSTNRRCFLPEQLEEEGKSADPGSPEKTTIKRKYFGSCTKLFLWSDWWHQKEHLFNVVVVCKKKSHSVGGHVQAIGINSGRMRGHIPQYITRGNPWEFSLCFLFILSTYIGMIVTVWCYDGTVYAVALCLACLSFCVPVTSR